MKRKEITALNVALRMDDVKHHITRKTIYWKSHTKEILYRWVVNWITDRIRRTLLDVPLSKLLQMSGTCETVLVVIVKNNIVDEVRSFSYSSRAEEYYTKVCINYGAQYEHMGAYLEDGYYEWTNGSVCLTHPEKEKI